MNNYPNPTGDDGELRLDPESDEEKPKRKPKPREYREVRLRVVVVVPLTLILLILATLLFVSRTHVSLPSSVPTLIDRAEPVLTEPVYDYAPALPFNQARLINSASTDGTLTVTAIYTATPANYDGIAMCGPLLKQPKTDGTIMFVMGDGDNTEIFALVGNGEGLCRVTQNLIEEKYVRWSPTRVILAFSSRRSDSWYDDIYTVMSNRTGLFDATGTLDQSESLLDWSSESDKLIYSTRIDGSNRVNFFTADVDSGQKEKLTLDVGNSWEPIWSPLDQKIAYITSDNAKANTYALYMMNLDGSNVQKLPTKGPRLLHPRWSRDGLKIAYEVMSDTDEGGIWVTDTQDFSTHQVVRGGRQPTWSPDSQQIAYIGDDYGIYAVSLHKAHTMMMTEGLRVHAIVDWR